jgi:hypothetical protein
MDHPDYFAHSGDEAASGAERFTSGWIQPSLGERTHGSYVVMPDPSGCSEARDDEWDAGQFS